MLRFQFRILAGAAALMPVAAMGQQASSTQTAPSGIQRSYTPADFVTFAPKTAYDMLVQVPSFTIISASRLPSPVFS
jgi:hypothetical protein